MSIELQELQPLFERFDRELTFDFSIAEMVAGDRNVCLRYGLGPGRAEYLTELFADSEYVVWQGDLGEAVDSHHPQSHTNFIVGRTDSIVESLHEAVEPPQNPRAAGSLLDFPPCCIQDYISSHSTEKGPNYYLKASEISDLRTYPYQNNRFTRNSHHTHVPCTLTCEQSIESVDDRLEAVRQVDEQLYQRYIDALKSFVIYRGGQFKNVYHFPDAKMQGKRGVEYSSVRKIDVSGQSASGGGDRSRGHDQALHTDLQSNSHLTLNTVDSFSLNGHTYRGPEFSITVFK